METWRFGASSAKASGPRQGPSRKSMCLRSLHDLESLLEPGQVNFVLQLLADSMGGSEAPAAFTELPILLSCSEGHGALRG